MTAFFTKLLSMSLTGSLVLLAVLLLRLPLRRAPRKWVCLLWIPVLFRLLCPVTLEAGTSLVPERLESGALVAEWTEGRAAGTPVLPAGRGTADAAPAPGGTSREEADFSPPSAPPAAPEDASPEGLSGARTPGQVWLPVLSRVWLAGAGAFLLWSLLRWLRLRARLREAVRLEKNVYEAEGLPAPFVLGILRPRIYLPWGMREEARRWVLLHERAHLRRLDPLWKLLGWAALGLHWFNPLCWLAFHLAVEDMELACDEAAARGLSGEERRAYSQLLLDLSAGKPLFTATPLGFGEGNVKKRIRGVLNWKEPRWWMAALALLLLAAVALLFALGPRKAAPETTPGASAEIPETTPLPRYPVEEGWTLLSDEELGRWTETLATFPRAEDGSLLMFDENGASVYDLVGCCFTSFYRRPEDLDLHAFLKYFDDYDGDATEEEYQALLAAGKVWGRRWSHVEDMPVPLRRIRAETVEGCLQKYYGIGLRDLAADYRTQFRYLPETDCFYSITSDFGPGMFTPLWGEAREDILRLHAGDTCLTLRVTGEDWKILSFWNRGYDPNSIQVGSSAPRGRNTSLLPEVKWVFTPAEADFCGMEDDALVPGGTIPAGERLTVLEEERTPEGDYWFRVRREALKAPEGREGWVRGDQVTAWTEDLVWETLAPVYLPAGTVYYPLDFSDYAPDGVEDRVKEEYARTHAYDLPCAILETEGDWAHVGVSGGLELWVERGSITPGSPDDEPPGEEILLIRAGREAAEEAGFSLLPWGAESYFRWNTLRYDVYYPAEGGAFVRVGFPNPETAEPGGLLPDEIEWIEP